MAKNFRVLRRQMLLQEEVQLLRGSSTLIEGYGRVHIKATLKEPQQLRCGLLDDVTVSGVFDQPVLFVTTMCTDSPEGNQ